MAPVVHEIDPDADTVIILRSPGDGEYFAWWDDSPFDNLDILDQLPFSMKEWDTKMSISDDIEVHQPPARAFITKESDWVILNVPEGSVLYLVSSRHLELASPVFKAALSPNRLRETLRRTIGGQRRSSRYPYLKITVAALERVLLNYSQEQVEAILELEATRIEWFRANGFELC
ncbi:uncharacterized protein J4E78_009659 [Alternaria triticimaculans]|uniref:uncharacterized protein n=1 Tax=Alternaria triticimaculans TaxID=297637 RepID=UPI0020C37EEB|nr:uncharacterized protein J4E78_009659 [Alternaria triticimaculans]KAI4644076.1 hypothetical protein J4E78_009659 [Alternaria triticimaculans]